MTRITPSNCYDDRARAEAFAQLEFANTYHLAFRDLPAIFAEHVKGNRALDFGCGTGRSTRFLGRLGFEVTGIDIAPPMIAKARELDEAGDYRLIKDDDFSGLETPEYELALSAFAFDNIPGWDRKVRLLHDVGRLLTVSGKIVNIVSAPDIYRHEWASFDQRVSGEPSCQNRRSRTNSDKGFYRPAPDRGHLLDG